MDYKKKYEEILGRARSFSQRWYGVATIDSEAALQELKEMFPELEDSEHERIRKDLIEFIRHGNCVFDSLEQKNKFWDWLERQKITKNTNKEDEEVRQYIIRLMKQRDTNVPMVQKALAWLEKQGGQNPADKVESKFRVKYAGNEYNVFEVKDTAGVTFYGIEDSNHLYYVSPEDCEIVDDCGYGVKEKGSPYPTKSAIFSKQKSAWSEEDERIRYAICDTLDRIDEHIMQYNNQLTHQQVKDWLKSIKERMKGE